MNIGRILAPVEVDDHLRELAIAACQIARSFGAELHFLHVNEPLDGAPSLVAGSLHPPAYDAGSLELEIRTALTADQHSGISLFFHDRRGEIVEEIVQFTKDAQIDLIVLGHSTAGFISRRVFFSTFEDVVEKAPCHIFSVFLDER